MFNFLFGIYTEYFRYKSHFFSKITSPGGLVITHNINPRMADPGYIKAITTDSNLGTIVRSGGQFNLKEKIGIDISIADFRFGEI